MALYLLGLLLLCPALLNAQTTAAMNDAKIELAFVADTSMTTVGPTNHDLQKAFIIDIVNGLTIGSADTRVALMSYAATTVAKYYFMSSQTLGDVLFSISKLDDVGTGTNSDVTATGTAIKDARRDFFPTNRAKDDVIFLITDCGATDAELTLAEQQAEEFQNAGGFIHVVAINCSEAEGNSLKKVASKPTDVYFTAVDGYDMLADAAGNITAALKADPVKPPTTAPPSTPPPTTTNPSDKKGNNGAHTVTWGSLVLILTIFLGLLNASQ